MPPCGFDTALRGVREETGHHAEILAALPGAYGGNSSQTGYFLIRPVGEPEAHDGESKSLRWVSFAGAEAATSRCWPMRGRCMARSSARCERSMADVTSCAAPVPRPADLRKTLLTMSPPF